MQTAWGYDILDNLCPMMTRADFDRITGMKFASDNRVDGAIQAVEDRIRNYCGWHLNGPVACKLETVYKDISLYMTGDELVILLPARFVTEVSLLKVNGVSVDEDDFTFTRQGALTAFGIHPMERRVKIEVEYKAGIPECNLASLKDLIVNRVVNALTQAGGIQSETAGGVSISYSATWVNPDGASALTSVAKEILEPYARREVF